MATAEQLRAMRKKYGLGEFRLPTTAGVTGKPRTKKRKPASAARDVSFHHQAFMGHNATRLGYSP